MVYSSHQRYKAKQFKEKLQRQKALPYKWFFLRPPNSAVFPNFGMFLFLRTLFLRHILWTKRDLNSAAHFIKV
jgi:hypothetical protein